MDDEKKLNPIEEEPISNSPSEPEPTPTETEAKQPDLAVEDPKKKKRKKFRRKIIEIDEFNDMRYRGPLSYIHLRAIAWFCLALLPISALGGAITRQSNPGMDTFWNILSLFANLATPLFLLANFSVILRSRESFKSTIILYAALTGVMALAYYLIVYRYLGAVVRLISEDDASGIELTGAIGSAFLGKGFNVFLDLLLCTLFFFFISYRPTKWFPGKWIILFRSFSLIIVLYLAASQVLKFCHAFGYFSVPPLLVPWIASKPFLTFLAFIGICLFVQGREKLYIRLGGTKERYIRFLNTNANSFSVSIFIAGAFIIAAILDFIALIITIAAIRKSYAEPIDIDLLIEPISASGIGSTIPLILISPIAVLFSYTKHYEKKTLDRLVPIGGIALLIIVTIEMTYWFLNSLVK